MTANEDVDAFERMLVEALPPRELRFASEFLSELRNLRLRTSIGPDSERIRELEAERLIADAWHNCENDSCSMDVDGCAYRREAADVGIEATSALRAAGLLPGPGDIVVSREALTVVLDVGLDYPQSEDEHQLVVDAYDELSAALSQPHPEETP